MPSTSAPGRVNLIGEHIDYHSLPVLPMAIGRRVTVHFTPSTGTQIHASSKDGFPPRSFTWTQSIPPYESGDWGNYLKAAARAVALRWGVRNGIHAEITGNIPPAAGLSSSSALLVAFTIALLQANQIEATLEELMDILPDGEQYVGTRGGGMDHAISLAGQQGCALEIHFQPFRTRPIRIPADWAFLVAHSLRTAEKSSAVREHYNQRRYAGQRALQTLGLSSYHPLPNPELAARLTDSLERRCFLHVVTEAARVQQAIAALESSDAGTFGRILNEGHRSLRDQLEVSCPELDRLTDSALHAGALGARLTGAGFGGCAIILTTQSQLRAIKQNLIETFYRGDPAHIFEAVPSQGAMAAGTSSPTSHP
jgi:galactokinase